MAGRDFSDVLYPKEGRDFSAELYGTREPTESGGFGGSFAEALKSRVKTALPSAKLYTGLGDQRAATDEILREQAQRQYKETEFSEIGDEFRAGNYGKALGKTWDKFKEVAGSSIGSQAPGILAGVGAQALAKRAKVPTSLPGLAAYGVVTLGSYIADNIGRQKQEQAARGNEYADIDRLSASAAAAGQTALDVFGLKFFQPLGKLIGLEGRSAADLAAKEIVEAATNRAAYMKAVASGAATGIAFEVPQEVAQSVLERWQAGLEVNPFKDPKAAQEYAEAAKAAILLGGPMGGASSVYQTYKARQTPEAQGILSGAPVQPPSAVPPAEQPPVEPQDLTATAADADQRAAELVQQMQAAGAAPAPAPVEGAPEFTSPLVSTGTALDPVEKLKYDLEVAKQRLADMQAKKVRGGPISVLKDTIKDLEQQISDAELAAQTPPGAGGTSVDQSVEGTGGAGISALVQPGAAATSATGIGALEPSGVVPTEPTAGPVDGGEGVQPSALIEEQPEVAVEEQPSIEAILTPAPAPAPAPVRAALPRPQSPDTGKMIAERRTEKIGKIYDSDRKVLDTELPRWSSSGKGKASEEVLTDDAKQVFLSYFVPSKPETFRVAKEVLYRYLNEQRRVKAPKTVEDDKQRLRPAGAAGVYEINRGAFRGVANEKNTSFPAWSNLSPNEREDFTNALIEPGADPFSASAEKQESAFRKLAEKLAEREPPKMKARPTTGAPTSTKKLKSYETALKEAREQRESKDRRVFTPEYLVNTYRQEIIEDIEANNLDSILESMTYRGSKRLQPVMALVREAKLKTKIKFAEALPDGHLAVYEPKTDTILVTQAGLKLEVLAHEAVHAATVQIINKYLTGDKKDLTPKQLKAVKQLEKVMEAAKKNLADGYPSAFENLYEFVAYAMTNEDFQKSLASQPMGTVESIAGKRPTMWSDFVKAVFAMVEKFLGANGPNLLTESYVAFERIVTPPKAVIEMEPLPVKATPSAKAAEPVAQTPEEYLANARKSVELKDRNAKSFFNMLLTRRGYEWTVTKFQNSRRAIKQANERAELFGVLKRTGKDLNDVYGQFTRSTGIAVDTFNRRIREPSNQLHDAIKEFAGANKQSLKSALADLHLIFEARHEPERRRVKYLRAVPLDDHEVFTLPGYNLKNKDGSDIRHSAEGWRKFFMEELSKPDPAIPPAEMRKLLEGIVFSGAHFSPKITDAQKNLNDGAYNVIADRSAEEIAAIRMLEESLPPDSKKALAKVTKAVRELEKVTKQTNKDANYWSKPVDNIVEFYGYKDYIPFKGRPGATTLDESLELSSRRLGGEFQEYANRFEGRTTESENPILQMLADGAGAALRLGRRDLTLSMKNAVADKILSGKKVDTIPFSARYLDDKTKADIGGPDKIFHYNTDGTIDVISISNKEQLEAIRRSYRESTPILDIVNIPTSVMGQFHTRYNVAFAPMDLVRNTLTNAFIGGAELGPKVTMKIINKVVEDAPMAMPSAFKFSRAYTKGEFARLEALAGGKQDYKTLTSEQRYFRDILDYVELGGRVEYLQGVAAKGALDNLIKDIERNKVLRSKDQIDNYFNLYNDIFELSNRVSTYRALRDHFISKGESPENAKVHAVEYTKNLANFEQTGEWGKVAGAMFMFFRPAATGAVRAIDSLIPILGFNEAKFREEYAGSRSPEEIDKAVKTKLEQQRSARIMVMATLGFGVTMYMLSASMAGDDEAGRNKTRFDNPDQWTRYARFHIPGTDGALQIPWGFGLGAFAAAGAQLASVGYGNTNLPTAAKNIFLIGLDSFLPLPFSRISPLENPAAWAVDTMVPSVGRPLVEYVMNLDGLGREIYNDRQSRYGDAYTGGDNVPQIYKDAAIMMAELSLGAVNVSPNTMYFFANNYADAIARYASGAYSAGMMMSGNVGADIRSAKDVLLPLSSYIGTYSDVDAREFSKARDEIKEIERRLNTMKPNIDSLIKYNEAYPLHEALVEFYNSSVQGELKTLETEANDIRADRFMTPREKKEQLEFIKLLQNQVKRDLLEAFKLYM